MTGRPPIQPPPNLPPLLQIAWLDCLRWAITNPDIMDAFRRSTSNQWKPSASPIEQMVDAATGADYSFLVAFVDWFNEWIWGLKGLPEFSCLENGGKV